MKDNKLELFMIKFKNMCFVDIDDLYIKKNIIKKEYDRLEYFEKEIYKWYFFYQLCMVKWRNKEKIYIKDSFWSYINNNFNESDINNLYIDFCCYRDGLY